MTDPPIDCTTIRRYRAGERARIDGGKDGGVYTQRNFPFSYRLFVSVITECNNDNQFVSARLKCLAIGRERNNRD